MTGAATASFYYDADGKQVKSTVNGVTTYYVGNHYIIPLWDEKKGTTVTKYYFAGATRLAARSGTGGTLRFLLGDHLGSSSVTTDANGAKTASALYKAFGETRYTLGNLSTDYKFTGQREEASLGIYFFNARWMDPSLGRFTSPDTIVPTSTQGTQAWDRYAFVNNNPVRYTDPTGHGVDCGIGESCMGNQANQNDTVTCADPDATNYGAEGSCTYSSGEGEGSGGGGKPRYSPNPSDPPQCPTLATPDCEIIAYGNYTDAQLYFLAQQMFKAGIGVAIIMTIVAAFVAGPCPYCTIAIEIWAIGEAAILSEASSYFSDAANSGAETCMRDCRTGVILYDDSGAGGYGHLSYDGGIPSMPLFGPIGVWAIKNNMISAWGYNGDGSR